MGLLKRNSVDRMAFDLFFNHLFMNKPETPKAPADPVAFMPAEESFTPPKAPSPMQLAQQETLGEWSEIKSVWWYALKSIYCRN